MSRRNVILILLAGFVLAFGAAGAAQRDRTTTRESPATADVPVSTPGGLEANVVEGALPADRTVRAVVGDEVELTVSSDVPDIAKITELGVQTAVGPGIPGLLRFTALSPGNFAVALDVAGTKAGTVQITAGGEGQPEADSP